MPSSAEFPGQPLYLISNILNKEIFFHVGLGKTGTTYLQYKVFPKLKDIFYIQRTRYKNSLQIIERSSQTKILVSNEFDRQLEQEAKWFSAKYPEAKVIIVFRRHDSWIASQYRRFVKNGFYKDFSDFFDIDNDMGEWKRSELNYSGKIQIIEKYFTHKPLVLFYEDMKRDPYGFLDTIARFTKTDYDKEEVSLSPIHRSYNEKQLRIFRKLGKVIFRYHIPKARQPVIKWLQRISKQSIQYPLLYGALLVPDKFVSKEPLIPEEQLQRIRSYFEEDWNQCIGFAKRNNPS